MDDDENDEDKSNLVTTTDKKKNGTSRQTPFMTKQTDKAHDYVKVNINESHLGDNDLSLDSSKYHHQANPLATSTSTPV